MTVQRIDARPLVGVVDVPMISLDSPRYDVACVALAACQAPRLPVDG